MPRKTKQALEAEYKKARIKYMRHAREFERCHPESKRYISLREKAILAEEECIFLQRKITPGLKYDKLIL